MNDMEKICNLLDEIKNCLLNFEKETMDIISCNVEDIEKHTQNRVDITQKLDSLFGEIDSICENMENGDDIKKMIRNVSLYTNVKKEEEKVFLKSQEIFSVFTRIKDSDVQAVDRINIEKEMLIKKIKDTNNGQQAKAAKFSVGVDDGMKKHFDEEKKLI